MDCQSKRTLMGLAEYVAGELGLGLVRALISHMTHRLCRSSRVKPKRYPWVASPPPPPPELKPARRKRSGRDPAEAAERQVGGASGSTADLATGKPNLAAGLGEYKTILFSQINILFRRCGSGATRSWRRCGKDKRSIWFNAPVEVDRLRLHDYHTVIKWEITLEEKNLLRVGLESLPEKKMHNVLQIVRKRNGNPELVGGEIELDIDEMDVETQWELDRFVNNFKKALNKSRRAAIVNGENADVIDASVANDSYVLVNGSTATMVDNGDVAMAIESKDPDKITTQAEQLDEYVDIGDEMPTATLSLNIHRPAIRRPGKKNANSNLPISGD
uniref:Putative bromodomain-containing protein n=1 Tax=Oryza sativa subsp. japonica TaxID=39947 RepID=I4DI74_ORYSJ|nr:putative bromodomain-containing protein [Oryza sativa Japonica Group]